MNYYSIHDSKAKFFMPPFAARTHEEAQRIFTQAVNDFSNPNNAFAFSPADYTLHYVFTFDEDDGQVTDAALHDHIIVNGKDVQKSS